MTPVERIQQAFLGSDRAANLNRTVEQLAREGVSQTALDDALGRLLDRVRADGGGEAEEEIVASVGDRLHGWCHSSRVISANEAPTTVTPPAVDAALPCHTTQLK